MLRMDIPFRLVSMRFIFGPDEIGDKQQQQKQQPDVGEAKVSGHGSVPFFFLCGLFSVGEDGQSEEDRQSGGQYEDGDKLRGGEGSDAAAN